MNELILKPQISELIKLEKEVNDLLKPYNIDDKTLINLKLIIEEIFSNICNYAYPTKEEDNSIKIQIELNENILKIEMNFIDKGIEFNPLNIQKPETPDSIEDVPIGGLGISIMREYADDLHYKYSNNQNILTITKNLD
jgi:serine/threonine-protein kinase RsbW